tara:strand:- start:70 stop:240 length:171 start_codon:yes stop_codon:yes gene_type:complete
MTVVDPVFSRDRRRREGGQRDFAVPSDLFQDPGMAVNLSGLIGGERVSRFESEGDQ